MKYSNPKIAEGINTSDVHPLKEFALLSTGIIAAVVLIAIILSYLLDWATQYIPFRYEQQLAAPIVEEMLDESNEIDVYLQSLADKTSTLMALPHEMKIEVHYVNDDMVNAMATLGGHIFIYRGLLEKLPSENALVMLLGHEIAHVKLRHPLKSLNKGLLLNLLLALISGQSTADVSALLSDTSLLTLLNFNRSQEQDADYEAAVVNHAWYQHNQGAFQLLHVLQQETEVSLLDNGELFNTHPDLQRRVDFIKTLLKKNHWKNEGQLIKIPAKIVEMMAINETI